MIFPVIRPAPTNIVKVQPRWLVPAALASARGFLGLPYFIALAAGAAGCGRGCDETTCERPSAPLEGGCAISDTPDDATL
eukprot:1408175-Pleurochrysis_carterae.AAC.1